MLLLGPTGSGKTPLGDFLQTQGFGGRRCVHFDFGAQLREAAASGGDGMFRHSQIETIRRVLDEGALLDNPSFCIAERVLTQFIKRRGVGLDDLVVLNGLPRHIDQARDVDRLLRVVVVVSLECPPAVAMGRIRDNTAGDRQGRSDDREDRVRQRLRLFEQRTVPVLEHYRRAGVKTVRVAVDQTSEPAGIAGCLLKQGASVQESECGGIEHGHSN